jgi:hypothetical protein
MIGPRETCKDQGGSMKLTLEFGILGEKEEAKVLGRKFILDIMRRICRKTRYFGRIWIESTQWEAAILNGNKEEV